MRTIVLLVAASVCFIQCSSIDKMIATGAYDEAFVKAHRKIIGKKYPKEKHRLALREAYHKAVKRDLDQILRLQSSGKSSDWEKVLGIYRKLDHRQDALQALIPLEAGEWEREWFDFFEFDSERVQAEDKLVEVLYQEATGLMIEARLRNREAARNAYVKLNRILDLRHSYKNSRELQAESRSLGVTNVGLYVQNLSGYPLSEEVLIDLMLTDNLSDWVNYHVRPEQSITMDYRVTTEIHRIWTSPERIHETISEEARDIEDGWEYILDENGNVKKDSLGNDLKQPKLKTVVAKVIHTELFKAAYVEGTIRCENLVNHVSDHIPLQVEFVFSDLGARFSGNRRALSEESRRLIKKPLAAFPTDEQMIFDAIKEFRQSLREKMYRQDLYASL